MSAIAPTTAFVDVTVVPLDEARAIPARTVLVADGRIAVIGPAATLPVPDGAQVVAGAGRTLLPGLADMHVHLTYDPDPEHLILYLARGITTVRNFNAAPAHLAWRDEVARGARPGPTILTGGPGILGLPPGDEWLGLANGGAVAAAAIVAAPGVAWLAARRARLGRRALLRGALGYAGVAAAGGALAQVARPVPTRALIPRDTQVFVADEREARRAVADQAGRGYDFLKLHAYLPPGPFLAALDEGARRGMYPIAHLPDIADPALLPRALAAGLREVAHVEEFDFMVGAGRAASVGDPALIAAAARATRAAGARVGTTLVTVDRVLALNEDSAATLAGPEYAEVRPQTLAAWRRAGRGVGQPVAVLRDVRLPFYRATTRAVREAGVPLVPGTDVGVEGVIPGHSLRRELALLVEWGGFSPFEALAAATRGAAATARAMGRDGDWGTVAAGQRADLLLVEGDPLTDLGTLARQVGVMARGVWYPQAELDARVAAFVGRY